MAITQAKRTLQITTPLGKDALLVTQMTGVEQISQPFEWTLEMVSEKGDLNADNILGKNVTVKFELPAAGTFRHFNGFVTEFSQTGYRSRLHEYRAVVRPWFWFLSRTADCRIFQKRTIPQIFEDVVKQYGFTDYKLKLHGSYTAWEYCVQYRETDMNFLSRLLEQEGICYHFEHQDGRHTLILSDDINGHGQVSDYENVPYYPPDAAAAARKRDHLSDWSFVKSVVSGAYAVTDYDYVAPNNPLLAAENISAKYANSNYEIFDYPAELAKLESTESKRFAKIRVQELQTPHMISRGRGDAAGLVAGYRFKLTDYPRADLNIEYLITGTRFMLTSSSHTAGDSESGVSYTVAVEAISSKVSYRPPRITAKPVIHGSQTALVVGSSQEEIYTDEHGRVKVHFYWDRHGKQDENSSCWIRVAQMWAGKQWGAIHIPRVGQEVIVGFLEGDPDRPIITGRVYNGTNMPPWALPGNKTQSGVMTQSSKDGTLANANQIRFEDKKGAEELHIHAEKDQVIEVENDETINVGHDRTEEVGNNETISIAKDRTEKVGNNETITIAKNRTETVGENESIDVGKDQAITIGKGQTLSVGKDRSVTVADNQTEQMGKNSTVNVGKKRTTSVGDDDTLSVGKKLVIDAGDSVTIQTGSASITMKKDGTITIKGKDITLEGSGKINVKASSDVAIKGSKVTQN